MPAAFKDWHTYFEVDTKGSFGVLSVQHAFFKQRCCRCVNSEDLTISKNSPNELTSFFIPVLLNNFLSLTTGELLPDPGPFSLALLPTLAVSDQLI